MCVSAFAHSFAHPPGSVLLCWYLQACGKRGSGTFPFALYPNPHALPALCCSCRLVGPVAATTGKGNGFQTHQSQCRRAARAHTDTDTHRHRHTHARRCTYILLWCRVKDMKYGQVRVVEPPRLLGLTTIPPTPVEDGVVQQKTVARWLSQMLALPTAVHSSRERKQKRKRNGNGKAKSNRP